MNFGKALLAGVTVLGLSGCEKAFHPGDAMVWTKDGIREIISCENPEIHPTCGYTGTDDIPDTPMS